MIKGRLLTTIEWHKITYIMDNVEKDAYKSDGVRERQNGQEVYSLQLSSF